MLRAPHDLRRADRNPARRELVVPEGLCRGAGPIRRELLSDVYTSWSETGVDLGGTGRLVDHGDVAFDGSSDPWDLIERKGIGRAGVR